MVPQGLTKSWPLTKDRPRVNQGLTKGVSSCQAYSRQG